LTRSALVAGRSLPEGALSASTACPGARLGGAAGGKAAAGGGLSEGWVSVGWPGSGWVSTGGRFEDGPDDGARLTAGPGSGTAAGGTGGGRSLNNWALAGATDARPSIAVRTAVRARRRDKFRRRGRSRRRPKRGVSARLRRKPQGPSPREVMDLLFTENTANSSLKH